MVVEQELQKLFQTLLHDKSGTITVGESEVYVHITPDASAVKLETPVYKGGNYIPSSVRTSIKKSPLFSSTAIQTELILNEEMFEIVLKFQGFINGIDIDKLKFLLEEFAWIADEWRLLLDEQDRNDRLHIRVS